MGRMFAVVVFMVLLGLVAGFACAGGVLAYVFSSRGCPLRGLPPHGEVWPRKFGLRTETMILSFTKNGKMSPPLDKLVTVIMDFRYDPFEDKVVMEFNSHALKILEAIAKHAAT